MAENGLAPFRASLEQPGPPHNIHGVRTLNVGPAARSLRTAPARATLSNHAKPFQKPFQLVILKR